MGVILVIGFVLFIVIAAIGSCMDSKDYKTPEVKPGDENQPSTTESVAFTMTCRVVSKLFGG